MEWKIALPPPLPAGFLGLSLLPQNYSLLCWMAENLHFLLHLLG